MLKRILAGAAGAAFAAACYPALSGTLSPAWLPHDLRQATASRFGAAMPQPMALDSKPTRLVIRAIGVDAEIEARGLDSSRNLATPKNFRNVAWYDLGPRPGEPGNAILNGHVNWWTGDAVFTHLDRLRIGDLVEVVRADGAVVRFKVTATRTVLADARVASLFAASTRTTLTLITCSGVWSPLTQSDTRRLLVSATLA
jgi:sortase A